MTFIHVATNGEMTCGGNGNNVDAEEEEESEGIRPKGRAKQQTGSYGHCRDQLIIAAARNSCETKDRLTTI